MCIFPQCIPPVKSFLLTSSFDLELSFDSDTEKRTFVAIMNRVEVDVQLYGT